MSLIFIASLVSVIFPENSGITVAMIVSPTIAVGKSVSFSLGLGLVTEGDNSVVENECVLAFTVTVVDDSIGILSTMLVS